MRQYIENLNVKSSIRRKKKPDWSVWWILLGWQSVITIVGGGLYIDGFKPLDTMGFYSLRYSTLTYFCCLVSVPLHCVQCAVNPTHKVIATKHFIIYTKMVEY